MPQGWGFSSFLKAQGVGVLNSFYAREWGIRPSKKLSRVLPGGGGWSGLELTDT